MAHDCPGGVTAQVGILRVGVQVQTKGIKPLVAAEQAGQLLFLFLTAQFRKTFTHALPHISGAAADGTDGLGFQIGLVDALGFQNPCPFPLELQIGFAHLFHSLRGVLAPSERRRHDLSHRGAELPVNFPQPGMGVVDGGNAPVILLVPVGPGRRQTGSGPAQHLIGIGHDGSTSVLLIQQPPQSVLLQGAQRPLPGAARRGTAVVVRVGGLLAPLVAALHLLDRVQSFLVPGF